MRKNSFLVILCFILYIQSAEAGIYLSRVRNEFNRFKLCELRYILRTDALSIFSSLIEKENATYSVTGEMCFNHTFGLQLTAGSFKIDKHYIHSGYFLKTEMRCYLWNEYYSGLHAGIYGRIEKGDVEIYNNHLTYPQSNYEGGVCGGYQYLFNEHWLINPLAYAGINKTTRKYKSEIQNIYMSGSHSNLVIRVELGVGYMF